MLARRLGPINRERLTRLDAADTDDLEAILRAFIAPAVHRVLLEESGPELARMVWRAFSEPDEEVRQMVVEQFAQVKERFIAALARVLPGLPQDDLYWKFHFTVGAMVHTAGLGHILPIVSGGVCRIDDADEIIDRLVSFTAAGLRSTATRPGERE